MNMRATLDVQDEEWRLTMNGEINAIERDKIRYYE